MHDRYILGHDAVTGADTDLLEKSPKWFVTKESDPLLQTNVMTWIPPVEIPEERREVWMKTVDEAKSYIRKLPYGGPKLRAEIKKTKMSLQDAREEVFRAYYPYNAP